MVCFETRNNCSNIDQVYYITGVSNGKISIVAKSGSEKYLMTANLPNDYVSSITHSISRQTVIRMSARIGGVESAIQFFRDGLKCFCFKLFKSQFTTERERKQQEMEIQAKADATKKVLEVGNILFFNFQISNIQ